MTSRYDYKSFVLVRVLETSQMNLVVQSRKTSSWGQRRKQIVDSQELAKELQYTLLVYIQDERIESGTKDAA